MKIQNIFSVEDLLFKNNYLRKQAQQKAEFEEHLQEEKNTFENEKTERFKMREEYEKEKSMQFYQRLEDERNNVITNNTLVNMLSYVIWSS